MKVMFESTPGFELHVSTSHFMLNVKKHPFTLLIDWSFQTKECLNFMSGYT